MRREAWIVGMCASVVLSLFACSRDEPGSAHPAPMSGPSVPELAWREAPEAVEAAPISLTASDGTGLTLVSLEARTVIEDPLAFTELHLTFHNPEPRRREGRFAITLPPQAAVSRLAMRVGAAFQEGEVVERGKAQESYEDFLHRKQDPALLEHGAGNEFTARVFPIEPNAHKEIVVAYSEELARRADPYRLYLKGLPKLSKLDVKVQLGSSSRSGRESSAEKRGPMAKLILEERDYTPASDLEVRLPYTKPFALRSGNLVVLRVAPVPELGAQGIDALTVLFDTSASRALGLGAQTERLGALLSELARRASKDFELSVLAFDQDVEEIYRGPVSAFGMREKGKLLARDALGASNVEQALSHLADHPTGHDRVLFVGDGVITAGEDGSIALREAVTKLAAHGVRRLDVLAEGGIQDAETLSTLTRAGLKSTGVVLAAKLPIGTLADKLLRATRDRVEVRIAGANWVHPKVLEGVQAGDERLIYAELPSGVPLQVELDDAGTQALDTLEAPRPLVERAFARAKIAALEETLRGLAVGAQAERTRLEREIVALSMAHRVVCEHTALLVLESDQDYRRFNLARNALADILRVGDEGLELFERDEVRPASSEEGLDEARLQLSENRGERPLEMPVVDEGAAPQRDSDADARKREAQAPPPARRPTRAAPAKRSPAGPDELAAPKGESKASAAPSTREAQPPSAAPTQAGPMSVASEDRAEEGSKDVVGSRGKLDASRGAGLGTAPPAGTGVGHSARAASSEGLQIALPPALELRALVRLHAASGVDSTVAARVLRGGLSLRARNCVAQVTPRGQGGGRLSLELSLSDKGTVRDAFVSSGALSDVRARACIVAAARRLRFPKPEGEGASVQAGIEFVLAPAVDVVGPPQTSPPLRRAPVKVPVPALREAYEGDLAAVLEALSANDTSSALSLAKAAHERNPGDVLSLIALGEVLEAQKDLSRAARVYGSLIDLYPSRADLRRMAGGRLERLSEPGLALAADSYRRAVTQRPDHPSGHRLLAYALLKQGDYAGALDALERALSRPFRADRFEGADRILREDLALVARAYVRAEPAAEPRVQAVLSARGVSMDSSASLRFVLTWETDANDVDFHIYDGRGGHAYYMKPRLGASGALYADITTGYGPECFAITGRTRAYPYVLQGHYFARGPMGYGMGKLQVVEHDGQGSLRFSEHPFVIMKDKAFVELARLTGPLSHERERTR